MYLDFRNFKTLLSQFPEPFQQRVLRLKDVQQRPDAHPEGDVLIHTIIVFNRLAKFNNIKLSLTALFHDIGKDVTTKLSEKGILQAIGHELKSADLVKLHYSSFERMFLLQGYSQEEIIHLHSNVLWLVEQHMRVKGFSIMNPKKQIALAEHESFGLLHLFTQADSMTNVREEEINKAKQIIDSL